MLHLVFNCETALPTGVYTSVHHDIDLAMWLDVASDYATSWYKFNEPSRVSSMALVPLAGDRDKEAACSGGLPKNEAYLDQHQSKPVAHTQGGRNKHAWSEVIKI